MKKATGFTLVELMVTLAVAGILIAFVIPSFRVIIQNNKAVGQSNLMVTALNYARSEAIKRRLRVSVCASNSDQTACSGTATWADGWIVFTDTLGGVGTINTDADPATTDDVILKVWPRLEDQTTVTVTPAGTASISYLQTGSQPDAGVQTSLQLNVEDCSDNNARIIRIERSGRISSSKTSC